MKFIITSALAMFMVVGLSACDTKKPAETPAKAKAVPKKEATKAKGTFVEVSKEGTKFDPPVKVEQIPPGAHYCDMGTVHYARMERGDGKCTECGMMLKTKAGGKAGAAKTATTKTATTKTDKEHGCDGCKGHEGGHECQGHDDKKEHKSHKDHAHEGHKGHGHEGHDHKH